MNKDSILQSIRNLEGEVKQLQTQEFKLQEELYYKYDRFLQEKLSQLEFEEEKLLNKINDFRDKLDTFENSFT